MSDHSEKVDQNIAQAQKLLEKLGGTPFRVPASPPSHPFEMGVVKDDRKVPYNHDYAATARTVREGGIQLEAGQAVALYENLKGTTRLRLERWLKDNAVQVEQGALYISAHQAQDMAKTDASLFEALITALNAQGKGASSPLDRASRTKGSGHGGLGG